MVSTPAQPPKYSALWDFFLVIMALSAWPLLLLLRGPLVREAGGIGWNFIAFWPLGAALTPLLLLTLVDFVSRIRHRTFTVVVISGSLLAVLALLTVCHLPGVRESLVLSDLKNGSDLGFAHDDVSEHVEDDTIIGAEVLKDAKLNARLVKELTPKLATDISEAEWDDVMLRSAWLAAAFRAQKRPLSELSTLPNGARAVIGLLGVEAKPEPSLSWLGKVVSLSPAGSFKLGLLGAETARTLAHSVAASASALPQSDLDAFVYVVCAHPELLSTAEVDRLLEVQKQRAPLSTATTDAVVVGTRADLDRVLELRRELARRLGQRSTLGVTLVWDGKTGFDELTSPTQEMVTDLFQSSGYQVTSGKDVTVHVAFRRADLKTRYRDTILLGFDLNDGRGAPTMPTAAELTVAATATATATTTAPTSTAPGVATGTAPIGTPTVATAVPETATAPVAQLLDARKPVELPTLLDAKRRAAWLFAVPLYFFDITPSSLRPKS